MSPLEQSIKHKIENKGTPLKEWNINIYRGILTGCNEAFIITGDVKDTLIAEDPKSAEIIRPILRGKDIKRFKAKFADLWLITSHNGNKAYGIKRVDIGDYPAVKQHLDKYLEKIEKRDDQGDTPYNLRNCAYMDDFSKPKIVWGNLCLSSQFAYASEGIYINAPATMIVPGDKYILAILNSKIGDWYIRQLGVTRNGGYFEYKPMFVEKLPVPVLSEAEKKPFIAYVDKLLDGNSNESINLEEIEIKLNNLIYDLYKISNEEKAFIEKH